LAVPVPLPLALAGFSGLSGLVVFALLIAVFSVFLGAIATRVSPPSVRAT
jgi:hypothetical protein